MNTTTERKIKFVVDAVKWFDKVNGNTYHSIRATRCEDGAVIAHEWTYGYGNHYQQTALEAMAKAGWLPKKYQKEQWSYESENNYPILWNVRHGLKREMIANGVI